MKARALVLPGDGSVGALSGAFETKAFKTMVQHLLLTASGQA